MDFQGATENENQNKRIQETQSQVNDVVNIMRDNVDKVLERDQKLSELGQRADDLQQTANQFEQHGKRLRRNYWWKNLKMSILLGVVGVLLIIIFIG